MQRIDALLDLALAMSPVDDVRDESKIEFELLLRGGKWTAKVVTRSGYAASPIKKDQPGWTTADEVLDDLFDQLTRFNEGLVQRIKRRLAKWMGVSSWRS